MIALQTTPPKAQNLSTRNWLLDSLRSFAILLMVYYHLLYDLEVLYGIPTGIFHGHWPMVRILGAALFIFLAGYSITLSRNPIRNGCKVLLFACLISIGTLLSFPDDFVRFGILHLLGIGMLISPFFKLPRFNILIGIALFFLGFLPLNYPAWVLPIAGGEQHFSIGGNEILKIEGWNSSHGLPFLSRKQKSRLKWAAVRWAGLAPAKSWSGTGSENSPPPC